MSAKEDVIKSIITALSIKFDGLQLRAIEDALYIQFKNYEVMEAEKENTQLSTDVSPDVRAYQMFFVAKKVEGLSEKSLKYYNMIISRVLRLLGKPLAEINTNDIRYYLGTRQNVTTTTITNERRILMSFFGWLFTEEYITKNPMLKIKPIREACVVKKPFSANEVEELRDGCKDKRELAIVDMLLSTGMRREELQKLNRCDVDFLSGEVVVTGKGNKQRICYLNAPAKKHLRDYLESRTDDCEALIVAKVKPFVRIGLNGLGKIVSGLGESSKVNGVHPHRFRRTSATMALQRGMPIEQVRIMLGHEKIDTTLRYAITADETVKNSHARYM